MPLDNLQIIPFRKLRKRRGRQCLVPVGHGRDVVLQRQVAPSTAPAEGLNRNLDVLFERNERGPLYASGTCRNTVADVPIGYFAARLSDDSTRLVPTDEGVFVGFLAKVVINLILLAFFERV